MNVLNVQGSCHTCDIMLEPQQVRGGENVAEKTSVISLIGTRQASCWYTCRCTRHKEVGASAPAGHGRHGDAESPRTTHSRATSAAEGSAPHSECCSRAVHLQRNTMNTRQSTAGFTLTCCGKELVDKVTEMSFPCLNQQCQSTE